MTHVRWIGTSRTAPPASAYMESGFLPGGGKGLNSPYSSGPASPLDRIEQQRTAKRVWIAAGITAVIALAIAIPLAAISNSAHTASWKDGYSEGQSLGNTAASGGGGQQEDQTACQDALSLLRQDPTNHDNLGDFQNGCVAGFDSAFK